MTSGHFKPAAETTEPSVLMLEIAGQDAKTPRHVPVLIRNLSTGSVSLAVTNPWGVPDWDRYLDTNCVLRLEDPDDQKVFNIKAKIAWTKFGVKGLPPLSLGLQLIKPSGEALARLSNLLTHTSEDIKGLWDRYDQVQKHPGPANLVHRCYIAGIVLLVGGMVLQFAGSSALKMSGWALWLIGSLGIAGKIILPLWQKRGFSDQIGKTF